MHPVGPGTTLTSRQDAVWANIHRHLILTFCRLRHLLMVGTRHTGPGLDRADIPGRVIKSHGTDFISRPPGYIPAGSNAHSGYEPTLRLPSCGSVCTVHTFPQDFDFLQVGSPPNTITARQFSNFRRLSVDLWRFYVSLHPFHR